MASHPKGSLFSEASDREGIGLDLKGKGKSPYLNRPLDKRAKSVL